MPDTPLGALIKDAPSSLPLYLAGFSADVHFTPAYIGREDRQVVTEAFEELDVLVKAGFFAWQHIEARSQAAISMSWRDDGFTVHGRGAGLHHNLLVAVLRMIVGLHHTPAAARAVLVAALGEDAHALPPASHWIDLLQAIRLTGIESADPRTADRTDFDNFVVDAEIVVPPGFTDHEQDSRLIVRVPDAAAIIDKRSMRKLENAFMGVCNTGGFRSLTRLDEMPEEGEIFLRNGDHGPELIIDDYPDDGYGLIELLNAVSMGGNATLHVGDP